MNLNPTRKHQSKRIRFKVAFGDMGSCLVPCRQVRRNSGVPDLRARPGIRVRVGQIYQGSSPFYRARTPRAKTVINTNCPAVRQRGGSARSNTVATFEESSVNSGIRQAASRDAARQARGIPSCYCRRALGQQRPELWRFGFLTRVLGYTITARILEW
jgi:hypothetical protein